jgi:hypothetical protein
MSGSDSWAPPPGLEGRGGLKLITAPEPAAGHDWVLTPPPGARWRLLGGSAQLVTSATVATRQVLFQVVREGTVCFTIPSPNTQAASLTYTYQFLPGVAQDTLLSTYPLLQLPHDVLLDNRMRVQSSTGAIDTADQWSAVVLLVEELGATY